MDVALPAVDKQTTEQLVFNQNLTSNPKEWLGSGLGD